VFNATFNNISAIEISLAISKNYNGGNGIVSCNILFYPALVIFEQSNCIDWINVL
jgi:hypothetical protein